MSSPSVSQQFSKLSWVSAVLRAPLPPAQRAVIVEIGLHSNSRGEGAWRANGRIVVELGASLDTVKRARRAAVECGLMVVTKPAPRGAGNTRTTEYRLTIPPINGCATAPISDDKWVQPSAEMGAAEPINGCATAPEIGAVEAPPLGSSLGISLERELGPAPAADEPLDPSAVPDPPDALSPQDSLDEKNNIIDAEIVDEPHDPEPPRYCTRHPDGTDDPCGGCGWRKDEHQAWQARQTSRVLEDIARRSTPPERPTEARYRCSGCRDTNVLLMNDGRPGRPPAWCKHNGGGRHVFTAEDQREHADLLARLNQGMTA